MKQDTVKIQFDIPRPLAEALWAAAAKDLRTHKAFLTRLLQEAPSVRDFILKSVSTENVKIPVVTSTASAPVVAKPAWVPNVPVFAPSTLRPDGKPYELGYPSTLSDGTVFHSVAEWQSSPEYVARQARFAELDKAAGK